MTVHVDCARVMLDSLMAQSEGGETVYRYSVGLREGRWSDEYVDSIGQIGHLRRGETWPLEQVAAFAKVHAMIDGGKVAMVEVGTTGPPGADKEREANAEVLSRLPAPFTCSVDMTQHNAAGDGLVTWTEPIKVTLATGLIDRHPDGGASPVSLHSVVPPGHAPLEIGSSHPSRTWLHLAREGGAVARWPYGHSWFRLLLNLDYPAWIERREEGPKLPSEPVVLIQEGLW